MKKKILIDHGTYPFDIMVLVNWSDKQVANYLNKYIDMTPEDQQALGFNHKFDARTTMLDGGQTVLRLNEWVYDAAHLALLTHETLHMVQFLFDRIGIDNDSSSW